MAFGSISQTFERKMAVDFSYPYDSTATGIVSKKPGHENSLMAPFHPFQPPVWASIAIAFVSFVITYWGSNYDFKHSHNRIDLNKALLQSVRCILMQGNYSTCILL